MSGRILIATLCCASALVFALAGAGPVEARGGGFTRTSPASSGGFASSAGTRHVAQPPVRQRGEIRDELQQRRDDLGDRLDNRRDRRDDDLYDDDYGAYWDAPWPGDTGAGSTTGTAETAAAGYVTELPCSGASYAVADEVYYQCDSAWYRRGFMGGMLVYLVSGPPPGI